RRHTRWPRDWSSDVCSSDLAGILFGLLTYKPHLGLVLPFALLALGAWRAIFAGTVTAIVLVGTSVAVFGLEPWRSYFELTAPLRSEERRVGKEGRAERGGVE